MDASRLTILKAYLARAADWSANADTARVIMEYVRDRVAPHLRVRRVELYELPKTISGKFAEWSCAAAKTALMLPAHRLRPSTDTKTSWAER